MNAEKPFAGRTLLVTGSGQMSGIGKAIGLEFAKRGADVVITDREKFPDTNNVIRSIRRQGVRCMFVPGDLTDLHTPQSLVDATVGEFRQLTDVVCNAAANQKGFSIDIPPEKHAEIAQVNFVSTMLLCRAALIQFLKQRKDLPGVITTVSSINVGWPKPQSPYNATKHAIEGWTETFAAQEMGHFNREQKRRQNPLRINCVRVGPTKTGETTAFGSHYDDEQAALLAIPRAGTPREIARNVASFHSEDMANITGAILPAGGSIPHRPMSAGELEAGGGQSLLRARVDSASRYVL